MERTRDVRLPLLCLLACSCAPARFYDRPVVWQLNDDAPIKKPKENPLAIDWTGARDMILLPVDRALTLDYGTEANDVNALDEVPESSWYHDPRRKADDMLGDRELSADEMAHGATKDEDMPVPPFQIVKGKTIGSARGFVALDSRGVRYAMKLDPPKRVGLATSVEVVVSRLAWACGWRVPSELMIEMSVDDLSIAKDASTEDEWGKKRPFDKNDMNRLLNGLEVADGKILALASRWLPGKPAGPFRYFSRRSDDPNDHFTHENRRELRGFGTFAAWVNDIDTMENNTLDMFEEGHDKRGHLVHYEQDVGGAFGVWAAGPMEYWMGHETYFDGPIVLYSLLSLGTYPAYWENREYRDKFDRRTSEDLALAAFDAEHFEPRSWRAVAFNAAFSRQTARDRYWAAKRIALIDEKELHAAVDTGHYSASDAAHVFDVLWGRRERLLRAFLGDVAALDFFVVRGSRLCFQDVWLRAGLGETATYDAGDRLGVHASHDGACVELPRNNGYHVLTLGVTRTHVRRHVVRVHLVATGSDAHVVGIER